MEPTTSTSQETPRATWPGAFGVFKPSLRTVALNLGIYLGLVALIFVIQYVLSTVSNSAESTITAAIASLVSILVTLALSLSLSHVLLEASESRKASFGDATKVGLNKLLPFVGLYILLTIILGLSVLLLIIPFFFVMPRLLLSMYFMLDQNAGPIESLKLSWKHTKGHVAKVYGIIGATIVMALPFFTIIGIPVALFLLFAYSAASVILYKYILSGVVKSPEPATIPDAPLPSQN